MTRTDTTLHCLIAALALAGIAAAAPIPARAEEPEPVLDATGPPAQRSPEAERIFRLYLSGELDQAEQLSLRHLEANPRDVEVKIILANCYRMRALEVAARASVVWHNPLEGLPPHPGAAFYGLASRELREALEIAPRRRDIWLGLCQMAREVGDLDGLADCTRDAAARHPGDPDFAEALREHARDFLLQRDYASAARVLEGIARSNPSDLPTLLATARAQYLAGRREEGVAMIDRALELRPDDAETHFQRAEIAAFEGDFARAARNYTMTVNLDPARGPAYLGMVTALHVSDRAAALRAARGAENRWKQVPKAAPHPILVALVGRLREHLAQPQMTEHDALYLAQAMARAEMLAPALAEVAVALSTDADLAEAHFLKGDLLGRIGQHDLARAAFEQALAALERHPERAYAVTRDEVLGALGQARFRTGEHEKALEAFSRVSDASAWAFELGLLLDRAGRSQEALRRFRQVVELGGDPLQVEEAQRYLSLHEGAGGP